jgi:predicted aminopeptidase
MRYLLDRERLTDERIATLPATERHGLDTMRRAQDFGISLGLASSKSYEHVIARDEETAVRVVTAAPADRLEPVSWWFPIVGRITYRGYFDDGRARAFAAGLAEQGYDTYVRPALMYSTLGWFADPIPEAVLRWPGINLVDVVLHEQVHETIFVASDPEYNESLASFIAQHATLAFFEAEPESRRLATDLYATRARNSSRMDSLYRELQDLYARVDGPKEARAQREAVFERYRKWFPGAPLSNSFVLARRTYAAGAACFDAELTEVGGDVRAFIRAHREDPGHRSCPEGSE